MQTLTDLCIHNIAEQIYSSPPMIQEMIIENSTDIIKEKVKKEVTQELISELKVLKTIVPSISKYIIINRTSFFNYENDYYKIYNDVPRHIVKLAIDISENIISELNNSFNILTSVSSRRYNFYTEEHSEQETSEEEQYESESSNY